MRYILFAVALAGCAETSAADKTKPFDQMTQCEQLSEMSASPYATPVQLATIMRRASELGCIDGRGW